MTRIIYFTKLQWQMLNLTIMNMHQHAYDYKNYKLIIQIVMLHLWHMHVFWSHPEKVKQQLRFCSKDFVSSSMIYHCAKHWQWLNQKQGKKFMLILHNPNAIYCKVENAKHWLNLNKPNILTKKTVT